MAKVLRAARPGFSAAVLASVLVASVVLIETEVQAQTRPAPECARVRTDARTGIPRWLEQCGQLAVGGPPEARGRAALAALAPRLGLRGDGSDLSSIDVRRVGRATNVRFQQVHKGVPVYLGQALVKYDDAGAVQLVNNRTLANLEVDVTPQLSAEAATARALDAIPTQAQTRTPRNTTLEIYGEAGEPVLAWHVFVVTTQPAGEWHAMVAATDGAILAVWDELRNDTGSGLVYNPSAVQQTGDTGLRDNADTASAALNDSRVSLTLGHLDSAITQLKGSYVDVTSASTLGCELPYTPGTASEASRVYNYTRDDDRFEEATAYAAIDGVQTWFQSLGFTNVNNRSIPVDVHCITADNSYFSSDDGALHFGDGGVDDAEDADIVIHEYGHAVQHDQVPGWGPSVHTEQRAMGEGFGDFLAGIYYVESGDSAFLANYRYCVGEWDSTSYNPVVAGQSGSGCLRWINGRNESSGADIGTYGGTPANEHSDGRFWSAAMTCIYEGMGANPTGRDNVMKLILAHHFDLVPDDSNNAFDDAVDALILEDQNLFGGANRALIASCAQSRLGITVVAQPQLSINDITVTEGDSGTVLATFTITRAAPTTGSSSVAWSTANGSAVAPGDYVAVPAGTVTFAVGETSKTVSVTVNGDTAVEANEGFTVNLSSPAGAVIADGTGVGRITNDDTAGFSINDATVTEGDTGTVSATFTVTRSGELGGPGSVKWFTANSTASAPTDFTAVPSTTLNFASGETSKTVSVSVKGETAVEANEVFLVRLTAAVGGTITDVTGVGRINNDDSASFSVGDATVTEGNAGTTPATFTITRSGDVAGPASVRWSTGDGTATAATDYAAVGVTTVNFAAGETAKTVAVSVRGDTAVEANETFIVRLSGPIGGSIADGSGLGRITNDDSASFSVNDVTVTEVDSGAVSAVFTITRSGATGGPASVSWSTTNGTAVAPGDYTAVAATTLNFAANETAKTVSVSVKGDTTVEGDETFTVRLTAAVGASIADGNGLGRIINDD